MTVIYLLRHGEIASDGIRRFWGQTDVRLNQRGMDQAERWRATLSATPFDAIYASDLSRCAETARIISVNRAEEVHLLPELREIHLGKLEGLAMDEVRINLRKEWEDRGRDISNYVPEGGESFSDLQRRVVPMFGALSRRHDGNMLIVAHAGVNRIILCHILEMPLSNLFKIEQYFGCLNLLEWHGGGFRITGMNLTSAPCSKH